ncbi:MAG: cytochrome C oxidase subunit IV family protein [Bacteroidota bacterium]|nr:cytochrome C oxidase subunit IV family protein [Bacteroidota bacterium]
MSYETTTHLIPNEHDREQVKRIWKTFWILLILTIAELSLGLSIYTIHKSPEPNQFLVLIFKGIVCILTLAKAFYIISIFMHLGDEIRNLIMTIAVPASLFIWFIVAFLYDGNSWKHLRNTDAGSHPSIEHVQKHPVPAMEKGEKN